VGMLGRLPRVGDRVEVAGIALTVTVRRGRRVVEVLAERSEGGADGGGTGAAGPVDGGPATALR
jgi:CBS domain containing-hemolysin-like protein